ncbi:hypothetical protein N0V90_011193 [Kalmusia sp. IMI 367209]|nr:hypothetical protein N0V90_011193 [Kalmusia sp. IMI 367209]
MNDSYSPSQAKPSDTSTSPLGDDLTLQKAQAKHNTYGLLEPVGRDTPTHSGTIFMPNPDQPFFAPWVTTNVMYGEIVATSAMKDATDIWIRLMNEKYPDEMHRIEPWRDNNRAVIHIIRSLPGMTKYEKEVVDLLPEKNEPSSWIYDEEAKCLVVFPYWIAKQRKTKKGRSRSVQVCNSITDNMDRGAPYSCWIDKEQKEGVLELLRRRSRWLVIWVGPERRVVSEAELARMFEKMQTDDLMMED